MKVLGAGAVLLTALGAFAAYSRSGKKPDPNAAGADGVDELDNLPAPAVLNFSTNDGPAEGQPPGRWQNFVEARRNGGIPIRGDINPAASVVPADTQDLGAPPVANR